MSDIANALYDDLRIDLSALGVGIGQDDVRNAQSRAEAIATLRCKIDEAKGAALRRRRESEVERLKMPSHLKKEHFDRVEASRGDIESHSIAERANRAEDRAVLAILAAADALDDAKMATLEAIVTQLEFEDTVASTL